MQIFKKTTKYDFMGVRRRFILMSIIAVTLSLAAIFIIGPKFGIDFMGGTEIQVKFQQSVNSAELRQELKKMGFKSVDVVTFGEGNFEYLLRLQAISPVNDALAKSSEESIKRVFGGNEISRFDFSPGGDKLTMRFAKEIEIKDLEKAIVDAGLLLGTKLVKKKQKTTSATVDKTEDESSKHCESRTCTWHHQDVRIYEVGLKGVSERVVEGLRETTFGTGITKMRSEWVGPKVGQQMRVAGLSSISFALLFIMLYIAIRFDLRFAPGAVVALIHDVIITMGIFTVIRVEVTLATVAALLTIIGYSLNDTIVVFDRIRENISKIKERSLFQVINTSINETLSRTILTSLTTLLVVAILMLIGWKTTIRDFSIALLIGVIVGTYSSIFVASPVVVWIDQRLGKKKV